MRIILVTILIFICSNITYSQEDNTCEHPDYKALVALYYATNGVSWSSSANWDDGTGTISCNPCEDDWFGVTCTGGRVTQLNLGNNNVVGHIPKEIGELEKLKNLSLFGNSLNGVIPDEILLLRELNVLALSGNNLIGEIPIKLCQLGELTSLGLSENQFSGSIPSCIGNLDKLENLQLFGNSLSGKIPSELGGLTNLIYLGLSENSLTGTLPESLSSLSGLDNLGLLGNQLEGCFPVAYSALCGIDFVEFQDNSSIVLNNTSWNSFCSSGGTTAAMHPDYPALVAFYKATNGPVWTDSTNWDNGNAMMSCDPCADDWYGVTCSGGRVSELRLGTNNLSGSIPKEVGDLDHLVYLDVINNLISGEIPKELGRLGDLEYLDLGRNDFEGSLPRELGYLSNLEDFYIDDNNLDGCWPDLLDGLCEVDRTEMDGNISSTISNTGWSSFCDLEVGKVHVDYDPIVSLYKDLDGINWVHDDGWEPYNSCSDPCDDWYGVSCVGDRVTGLDLSVNDLKGVLPDELEELSELTRIDLVGNQIEGVFPGPIAELERLRSINLKGNRLRGELPYTMPWPLLDTLSLGSNHLTGNLSVVHDYISLGLGFINLSNNLFSGEFFLFSSNFSRLEFLTVANNYLTGCILASSFEFCARDIPIYTNGNLDLVDFANFCSSGEGGCNACSSLSITINDDPFDLGQSEVAKGVITSGGRIGMDNSVMLQAGVEIELDPNFTVEANSNLILRIEDCDFLPVIRSLDTK